MLSIEWFIVLGVISIVGWVVTGICFSYYYYKKSKEYQERFEICKNSYDKVAYELFLIKRKNI